MLLRFRLAGWLVFLFLSHYFLDKFRTEVSANLLCYCFIFFIFSPSLFHPSLNMPLILRISVYSLLDKKKLSSFYHKFYVTWYNNIIFRNFQFLLTFRIQFRQSLPIVGRTTTDTYVYTIPCSFCGYTERNCVVLANTMLARSTFFIFLSKNNIFSYTCIILW